MESGALVCVLPQIFYASIETSVPESGQLILHYYLLQPSMIFFALFSLLQVLQATSAL